MSAPPPVPVAGLISGRGSNLQALMDRAPESGIAFRLVISDRPDAAGLGRAQRAGVDTAVVDHRHYPDRCAFERALAARIDGAGARLVLLAGFMRILSPGLVARYQGRMLNIHPSLLPKYRGLHTHRRVLAAGDREHGASVHFVTAELDGGPVILQARVPVHASDDEDRLAARVLEQEHRIYPQAVRWLAEGRVTLHGGRAWLDGQPLTTPMQLETAGEPVS